MYTDSRFVELPSFALIIIIIIIYGVIMPVEYHGLLICGFSV